MKARQERSIEDLATGIDEFEKLVEEAKDLRNKIRLDLETRQLLEEDWQGLEHMVDEGRKHRERLFEEARQKLQKELRSPETLTKAMGYKSLINDLAKRYAKTKNKYRIS